MIDNALILAKKRLSWSLEQENVKLQNKGKALDHKRKTHMDLKRALKVMGIIPASFHAVSKQKTALKDLLEKALLQRTRDLNTKSMDEIKAENEKNRNLIVANLSTVHEAYQFLTKKYVDADGESTLYMTADQLCEKYGSSSDLESAKDEIEEEVEDIISESSEEEEPEVNDDFDNKLLQETEKLMDNLLDCPMLRSKHIRKDSKRRYSMIPKSELGGKTKFKDDRPTSSSTGRRSSILEDSLKNRRQSFF